MLHKDWVVGEAGPVGPTAEASLRSHYPMYAHGGWAEPRGGESFPVFNPAFGTQLCTVADAQPEDVSDAVTAAIGAFEDRAWAGMQGRDRARLLQSFALILSDRIDEFAVLETLQVGRPIREFRAQLARVPEWLEYFAAVTQTAEGSMPDFGSGYVNQVVREPIGVVGLITPWNHPLLITIKKVAPALAAGNSLVIKPSELAPITPLLLAEALTEAGLPRGVMNVVPGIGAVAGKALVNDPRLGRLDVTGGTETGRAIASAGGHSLIPVTAELGGKAPVIVFDDVDLARSVAGVAFASFIASGQSCAQGARILLQDTIYDRAVDLLGSSARGLRLGDPLASETQLGPLVSGAALERAISLVEAAEGEGAEVLLGGSRAFTDGLETGHYMEPTIVAHVSRESALWREEVFGPVVVVAPFESEEEAINLANDTQFGLAASVWTSNLGRAQRVAERLDAGVIWINDHHRIDPASPWGGTKLSGLGSENGLDAYRANTRVKSIIIQTGDKPVDWYTVENARYS